MTEEALALPSQVSVSWSRHTHHWMVPSRMRRAGMGSPEPSRLSPSLGFREGFLQEEASELRPKSGGRSSAGEKRHGEKGCSRRASSKQKEQNIQRHLWEEKSKVA